ncbi:MAG: ABC transporter substrate-binding protein, partial [Thermoleophilaceae bacterium]
MPWQEQTLMIGRALGRAERARKIVEQVQARFAQARERYPEFDGATAILAYGGSDGYGAYASQDTRSRFFADLGFQTPPKVDELAGEGFFVEFSQERFRLMDQDGGAAPIGGQPASARRASRLRPATSRSAGSPSARWWAKTSGVSGASRAST